MTRMTFPTVICRRRLVGCRADRYEDLAVSVTGVCAAED